MSYFHHQKFLAEIKICKKESDNSGIYHLINEMLTGFLKKPATHMIFKCNISY